MVLESILNPTNASLKDVAILSAAFSIISVVISYQMFPSQASILSVAFITIFFVPFFQKLFETDEKIEIKIKKGNIFSRHLHAITIFSVFFLSIAITLSFMNIFLPQYNTAFSVQTETLQSIGMATNTESEFFAYLVNNSRLMGLIWILSAVFGSGAIFILSWNASVVGVFASNFVRHFMENGLSTEYAYIVGVPIGLSSIAIHGIPEIAAYFIAGIGGGILSVGILRERGWTKNMKHITKDSIAFLVIAEWLIIGAALLEAVLF